MKFAIVCLGHTEHRRIKVVTKKAKVAPRTDVAAVQESASGPSLYFGT